MTKIKYEDHGFHLFWASLFVVYFKRLKYLNPFLCLIVGMLSSEINKIYIKAFFRCFYYLLVNQYLNTEFFEKQVSNSCQFIEFFSPLKVWFSQILWQKYELIYFHIYPHPIFPVNQIAGGHPTRKRLSDNYW